MKRACILVNPNSGSGRRDGLVPACAARLESAGWHVDTIVLHEPAEAARLATEAARSGADAILAAGGDGTLRTVVAGLLDVGGDTLFGILPTGTANVLAHDLGVPQDGTAVADLLIERSTGALDVATANGIPFLCCLGVGFDAHVIRRLDELRTGNIGLASYVRPVLHAVRRYGFPRFHVTDAAGDVCEGVLAVVLNTPTYAGFLRPAPNAHPADGLLDAVVCTGGGRRSLPRWLLAAQRGRMHLEPDVRVLRSTSFRIEAEPPLPSQVDGEVGAATPVDILIRPAALQVARPPEPTR